MASDAAARGALAFLWGEMREAERMELRAEAPDVAAICTDVAAEVDRAADRLRGAERTPRRFVLVRHEDVSGVSGTGVVAEGVAFSNGVVALQWASEFPTSVVFHHRGV